MSNSTSGMALVYCPYKNLTAIFAARESINPQTKLKAYAATRLERHGLVALTH